jgi:hypothetical protein
MVTNNQLTISYELLYLMQWLLENEPERLKKLIVQALHKGLKEEMQQALKNKALATNEELQYSVVDFLTLLESLLQEAINEQALKTIAEKKLMPALDHIDGNICNSSMVQSSIEKASNRLESHPQENPQEILFKELLKNWKPDKKAKLN